MDVHALGLATAQGLTLAAAFYWDTNDGTRAFAQRFAARFDGRMPTMFQAGDYSATLHYLKARKSLGVAQRSGRAAVAAMKAIPTDDPLFGPGTIRADGRKLNPMFLFQVKTPAESRADWTATSCSPPSRRTRRFRPLAEGGCPMLRG